MAQRQPNECCKLRADVKLEPGQGITVTDDTKTDNWPTADTFSSGSIIGNELGGTAGSYTEPWCDLDDDGVMATDGSEDPDYHSVSWGMLCFLGTLNLIIKWLFIIIMLVVTIMIMYGGFMYVTAAGDPERAGRGKKVLMYAVVGLAVALLARVIPALLRFIIGV